MCDYVHTYVHMYVRIHIRTLVVKVTLLMMKKALCSEGHCCRGRTLSASSFPVQFDFLLNGEAEATVSAFLEQERELEEYKKVPND